MLRGEGDATAGGVSPEEVFAFVLDPVQYTKADRKVVWIEKLADTPGGMIAREDGLFLGRVRGSVITRYRWEPPHVIEISLVHGVPRHFAASFDLRAVDGGTKIVHVEEIDMGRGPLGWVFDRAAGRWFREAVRREVAEIARLLEAGERGAPHPALRE